MKKRLMTLALTLALLIAWGMPALAASNHYEDLWGKFDEQMKAGSGFIATLTGDSQGNSLLVSDGLSLSDLTADVTLIRSQRSSDIFQSFVNLKRGEEAVGEAVVFGDEGNVALKADFMPNALKLPLGEASNLILDTSKDYGWLQMLLAWAECDDEIWLQQIDKAGEAYRLDFEMWLADYAQVSTAVVDGAMTISYVIPAADVKAEMQRLLTQLMSDGEMLKVLGQLLTSDQVHRYLNPQWASQYLNILNALTIEGQIEVVHTQSMKGEVLSTRVVLPVPNHLLDGFDTFVVEADADHWYFSLSGDETLALRWDKQSDKGTASGSLTIDTADTKLAAEFACISETKEWTDADNREYLTNNVTLTVTNPKADDAAFTAFEPLTVIYEDALNSGPDRRNATYVDVKVTVKSGEGTDTLTLSGKTAANWALAETDLDGALPITRMDTLTLLDNLTQIVTGIRSWLTI